MDNQVLCGCCLSVCSGPYHDVPHSTFIVEIDKRVCVPVCAPHQKYRVHVYILQFLSEKSPVSAVHLLRNVYFTNQTSDDEKNTVIMSSWLFMFFIFFLLYFRKWTNTKNLFYKHVSRKKYTYGHEVQCC